VQDQEVADALVERVGESIELAHQPFVDAARLGRRQQPQHVLDALLDQEQAGGFERLEKAAGQSERHAIAGPGQRAPPGAEFQQPWLALRAPVELA
jgi:hypothetical protein